MTMISFSEVKLDGRKFSIMLNVLVQTWHCTIKTLSFLISHRIKLAVAFSSIVLRFVFVSFFNIVTFIL